MNEQTEACRKCGRPLQADFERCPYCGAKRAVGGNHVLRNSLAAVGLVAATLLIVLAVSPSFRADILSAFNKATGSASAAVSAQVPAATATATPKPTATPSPTKTTVAPTPQPPRERASDYNLSYSLSYGDFIQDYSSALQSAQNKFSAAQLFTSLSANSSYIDRAQTDATSVRHQLTDNVALSVSIIGKKPFVTSATVAAKRFDNTKKNTDANMASLAAFVAFLNTFPGGPDAYDPATDVLVDFFGGKTVKTKSVDTDFSHFELQPVGDTMTITAILN